MKVFSLVQKRRRLLLPFPTFNYCELTLGAVAFAPIKALFKEMSRFGNYTKPCPFVVGNYYVKDVQLDDSKYTVMTRSFSSGKYVISFAVDDENGAKAIFIGNVDIYFTFRKNKI
jgi:hypothetical protein